MVKWGTMKTPVVPEPEELEDTTTPEIVSEMDAAARRFYESTEYPPGTPDWRTVPDTEEDE